MGLVLALVGLAGEMDPPTNSAGQHFRVQLLQIFLA